MENKTIHLVVTYVNEVSGEVKSEYIGTRELNKCFMKVSFRSAKDTLGIPLYFDSVMEAHNYIEKASSNAEREFTVIQEFTYPDNSLVSEAKIIFSCKSDTWITMKEGLTERVPNIWASVRTLSICDKAAAEDYVRRFNEDAKTAYNYHSGDMKGGKA